MPELRRHERPDQPEPDHPSRPERADADRVPTTIQRLLDVQKAPERPAEPRHDRRVPANIQRLLDLQNPPKRPGFIYDAPDSRAHSAEKPPQQHPDITGQYRPMSEVAQDARAEQTDSRVSNPFHRLLNKVTRDVDSWSDGTQKTYEAIQHKIDPDRPAVQQTSAVVGQPNRPVFSPQAKDSPNDVVSHAFTVAVFVAEVGRRAAGLAHSHRRVDTS